MNRVNKNESLQPHQMRSMMIDRFSFTSFARAREELVSARFDLNPDLSKINPVTAGSTVNMVMQTTPLLLKITPPLFLFK